MKTLVSMLLLFASVVSYAQEKKYEIQSATIKKEMVTNGVKSDCVLYFDDFGNKEAVEMTMTMGVFPKIKKKILTINEGKVVTTVDVSGKTATRMTMPETTVNYTNLTPEMKEQFKVEELGEEDVNGKTCKKISTEMTQVGQVVKTISWIWKGIPLKSEATSNGKVVMSDNVIDIQEGSVDATKFSIPDGFKVTEM